MKKTDVTQPVAMATPFAEGVYSLTSTEDFEIPAATSTTADDSCVMDDGFLPITSTALDDGGKAPERKNFNGMFYLSTDQRFFLQNGGFITYNPDVAAAIGGYPQDAILDFIDSNGTYKKVRSLIDDNSNNFVADETLIDGTNWEEIQMGGGSSRNIGEIVASTIPLTDAGLHLLDGALIQGSGSYSAFVDYIAGLVTDYPDLFVTESDWQTAITTYGVCGKFVYDSVNNTVRLPKYGNQIITKTSAISTASTVPVVGNGYALGITNGTGSGALSKADTNLIVALNHPLPADLNSTRSTGVIAGYTTGGALGVTSDPTKSGLIADISSIKNYPLDCYYYIVIATSTKTSIQVDIDEIATDLNGKADVDLTNCTDVANIKMAHNAMPSNTYIDLTLGASGSTYTAPADGWFYVNKIAGADWHYVTITNTSKVSTGYSDWRSDYRTSPLTPMLPVQKGDVVVIEYNATGATQAFKFIYAQGSESEAN